MPGLAPASSCYGGEPVCEEEDGALPADVAGAAEVSGLSSGVPSELRFRLREDRFVVEAFGVWSGSGAGTGSGRPAIG